MIGSLDGTPPRELMRNSSQVEMVADHLWFVDQGTLVARPFDAGRELITGEARPIAEGVGELRGPGIGLFSVSKSGVLAFHGLDSAEKRSLTWRDRSGQSLGTLGPPGRHLEAVLSPDGKQAAVSAYEEFGFLSTYLYDVATEISTRFTFGEPYKGFSDLVSGRRPHRRYLASRQGHRGATRLRWDRRGGLVGGRGRRRSQSHRPRLVSGRQCPPCHENSSPAGEDGQYDIWVLPLDTEREPYPIAETPFDEIRPCTVAGRSLDGLHLR